MAAFGPIQWLALRKSVCELFDCDRQPPGQRRRAESRVDLARHFDRAITQYLRSLIRSTDDPNSFKQCAHQQSDAPREMARPFASVPTGRVGHFRIERSTPNYPGKVVWCPMRNSWQLIFKSIANGRATTTSYEDATGKPLMIAEGLSAEEYTAAREETYARAIEAWNILDKSKALRIPPPSARAGTCVPSPTSTSPSTLTSLEITPTLSSTVSVSQTESGSPASEAVHENSPLACAVERSASEMSSSTDNEDDRSR